MNIRSTCWSLTINNPTQTDEYNISEARQKGWKVDGQIEKGENGTPHYQLILKTPQVRFSAIKKVFPRAHIEPARNPEALQAYVHKVDSRVSHLPTQQELYPTQLQLFEWFSAFYNDAEEKKLEGEFVNPLTVFDNMIKQKIRQGYYIGAEVMNPQVRAYIRRFGADIAFREKNRIESRQDRQDTVENILIPEINVQEERNEESRRSSLSDA